MIIVNYHQISVRGESSPYDMSLRLFEGQIDALIDHEFSFVTLAEVALGGSEDRPRQCAITFDDGRLGAYEHGSRILRERGIKATYFICPDWLDRKPAARAESYSDFMTWDHVAELAREANVIGSHGKGHLPFFDVDPGSAAREVAESKRVIEKRLGISCGHFAGPWGQIDRSLMTLVRDCGYTTLCSTTQGPNKVPYELYRLRRLDSSLYRSPHFLTAAVLSHADAHSRLDVALLKVRGNPRKNAPEVEALAGFDVAICLDERAYELAMELGLRCLRHRLDPDGSCEDIRESLLDTYGERARARTITFTPVTLRGTSPAWTYLSSFLPGTSRTR